MSTICRHLRTGRDAMENIDGVILELCDRFSVGVNELIPQIIEYGKASSKIILAIVLFIFVVSLSVFLTTFICWRKGKKKGTIDFYNEDAYEITMVITTIISLIDFIVVCYSVWSYYMWIYAPKIMAFRYILGMVGK